MLELIDNFIIFCYHKKHKLNVWRVIDMRNDLRNHEKLDVLCAKSVGMTYGDGLHRGNGTVAFNS